MEPKGVQIGGILANIYRRDGRGTANFRDLYASRLILVAGDYISNKGKGYCRGADLS
jgi:hypothetical protein